jgi:EmrB/QacA subfamily drug resistance transporter
VRDVDALTLASGRGRAVLAAAVAGSAVTMITATVVTVALPELAVALDASTAGMQWVVTAYALALAALVLLGGALGDRLGRRRVFVAGTTLFGLASLAAAAAPTLAWLIVARGMMGIGAALLTPGSLAILESSFRGSDRAAAIGAWTGLGGVAAAVGPLVGGVVLDAAGWRPLFLLNLPVAAAAAYLAVRAVPESRDESAADHPLDIAGTVLVVAGLGSLTLGLIRLGTAIDVIAVGAVASGLGLLVAFVLVERGRRAPLVPPSLFLDRTFTVANLLTFVVYAALGGVFLLLIVALRLLLGFTGLQAGAATLPITVLMLLGSARSARFASRHGPRLQLTVGPLLMAGAALLLRGLAQGDGYLFDVLPALLLWGVGLVLMVAPVTATALAAAPPSKVGVASGVNNAVARTAGLLTVAVLPVAAGLGPTAFEDPVVFAAGYPLAMTLAAGLMGAGALLGWFGIPKGPILAMDE